MSLLPDRERWRMRAKPRGVVVYGGVCVGWKVDLKNTRPKKKREKKTPPKNIQKIVKKRDYVN